MKKKIKYQQNDLILSLIKDNLTNTRLVLGLNKLGLDAEKYHLHLGETIFQLIGFEKDAYEERAFERYVSQLRKIVSVDIFQYSEKLEAIASKIYENLIKEKELQESKNKKHGRKK